jgi:FlaA1/EpsC-like NDP-sugar epimerase
VIQIATGETAHANGGDPSHDENGSGDPRDGRRVSALRALFHRRTLIAALVNLTIVGLAYVLAFVVRFDMRWPPPAYVHTLVFTIGPLLALWAVTAALFHLNVHSWRFASPEDLVEILVAAVAATAAFGLVVWLLPVRPTVPRSVVLLQLVFASYGIAGFRMLYRLFLEWWKERPVRRRGDRRRVLVVGAGEAGSLVAREIERYPDAGYELVGFVDDDSSTLGIPALVRKHSVDALIIAIPSASPEAIRRIVERCEPAQAELTILPPAEEVLKGNVRLSQIREVTIEDLLAREPISLALPELAQDLGGKVVLITGAAGSIGSELARQVAAYRPSRLILLDQAETDLYFLELELQELYPELEFISLVGDILDEVRLEDLFESYRPDRVYHAAAYKHVPLMEANPREAVRNNVLGTLRVALTAGRHGVGKFVLISTDKAVRPTNVMGATKRMAELVTMACGRRFEETTYTAVRFGNVLGSQGSVIPIFKRQLAEGRPLTVTHPDVTRYFMTIPEAVQLVLQASVLPEGRGQIMMLDMGEPVRILDLARNLLRLAGVKQNGKKLIEFIGLRPGEKLHEELVGPDEETAQTDVTHVRLVRGPSASAATEDLLAFMRRWEDRLQSTAEDELWLEQMWAWCRSQEVDERVRLTSLAE